MNKVIDFIKKKQDKEASNEIWRIDAQVRRMLMDLLREGILDNFPEPGLYKFECVLKQDETHITLEDWGIGYK